MKVGFGVMSEEDMKDLREWIIRQLDRIDGRIDKFLRSIGERGRTGDVS